MTGADFRAIAAAGRLGFSWLGLEKTIKGKTKESMVEAVRTSGKALGAKKRLFCPKDENINALQALHTVIKQYWEQSTLPYFDKGVRLTTRPKWTTVVEQLNKYRDQILELEKKLEENRASTLEKSALFLGPDLYCSSDYPSSFIGKFNLEIEPVNIEPPSYLLELDPEAYKRQEERLNEKVSASLDLFEEEIWAELSKTVSHLVEKMEPGDDGKKKVFHTSTLENITDLVSRYQNLRVRSNADLDQAIKDVKGRLAKFDAAGIKSSPAVRQQVHDTFAGVAEELAKRVTKVPSRRVEVD